LYPSKCKELDVRKKYNNTQHEQICNIPQCNSLSLLEVTLQSNCKVNEHVRQNVVKANRCLHVLRSLRKEQHTQVEVDHVYKSLVLPNLIKILPFCVCSVRTRFEYYHTTFFLGRCYKRRFVSFPVYRQDCNIVKAIASVDNHPLGSNLPPWKKGEKI